MKTQKMVTMTQGFGSRLVRRLLVTPGQELYTAKVKTSLLIDGRTWFLHARCFAKDVDASVLATATEVN